MQWPVVSLYLLFGQYYDWTSFEPEESSLNAAGAASSSSGAEPTAHWDWGPVASAAPEQHWDSWGFPVVEPAPEQPASAWSAEALPHQDVPLVPKAASDVVAPSTPPVDEWQHYQQQEAMRLKSCRQVAALQQETPQPPSVDPLVFFAKAQANVPLVIDR